jgi:fructose-1,6-bisphosphatase-3
VPLALTDDRLNLLRALSTRFPTADSAIAEAAALRAKLSLPKGIVHVISDVHGEHAKLRHIINNASGALRTLVERTLEDRLDPKERARFLAVLYYPREALNRFSHEIVAEGRRDEWVFTTLTLQFEIVRALRRTYRRDHFERLLDPTYRELFLELASDARLYKKCSRASRPRRDGCVRAGASVRAHRRRAARRGRPGRPRPALDRVIETLVRQRAAFSGATTTPLGSAPTSGCALHRPSSGFSAATGGPRAGGTASSPRPSSARHDVYDDPAKRSSPRGRPPRRRHRRLLKAIAIMQFKAEGPCSRAPPQWDLEHRRLLRIGKKRAPSGSTASPTRSSTPPSRSPRRPPTPSTRRAVRSRIKSPSTAPTPRAHVWVVRAGVWTIRATASSSTPSRLTRRRAAIAQGRREPCGRANSRAPSAQSSGAFRKRPWGLDEDADWLWYLWGGPRSPLFGKDKLATFENYFIADEEAQREHKNPYFELINDAAFVRKIAWLFGCGDNVLLVNGHVPVKIEKGEQPVKRGGNAVTIDGALQREPTATAAPSSSAPTASTSPSTPPSPPSTTSSPTAPTSSPSSPPSAATTTPAPSRTPKRAGAPAR